MKPAKYFDNVILGQFTLTNVPVRVYVNGEYLTITDADDIEDPMVGFGMDENGGMVPFDYRYVDHLLVANNNITLDKYNKAMGAEDTEEKPAEDAKDEKEDTGEEEGGEDKKEKKGGNPFESKGNMKLKPMIEKAVSKAQQKLFGAALSVKRGDTEKSKVTKDVVTLAKSLSDKELAKFAGTKHKDLPDKKEEVTEDLESDKKKASKLRQDLAKLNLNIAKEEEKMATQNEAIVGIDTISEPYVFQVGDIIHNVNPNCMHYGSMGIVKGLVNLPDEMGTLVKYTVTNNGDTYSPGDVLTKTMDQLSPYGSEEYDYDDYEDDDYDSGDYGDWDIVSGDGMDDDDYEYNSYDNEDED